MATEVSHEPQRLDLRPPARGTNCSIVGLIPNRPEWVAAYAVMRVGKNAGPTIVDVCRISDLPEPQKKKAQAWMGAFARFVDAANPN
jgi:hypothetical protein